MDPGRRGGFDPHHNERLTQTSRHFARLIRVLDRDEQPPEHDLRQATRQAGELDSIIDLYPSECEQAYREAIASDALSEDQKGALQTLAERGGGFVPFAHSQLQPIGGIQARPGEPIETMLSMRAFACAGIVALILAGEQIELVPEAIAICGSA